MQPADTAVFHDRTRRGFSLIEAAIVLGVVGVVIGAIWVAASAVNESYKHRELISVITRARDGLSNALKSTPANAWPDEYELTDFAKNIGAIPQDGKHPYGGRIRIHFEHGFITSATGRNFKISLSGLNATSCTKTIMKLSSSPMAANGLSRITILSQTGVAQNITDFPMPIQSAIEACDVNPEFVYFQYSY